MGGRWITGLLAAGLIPVAGAAFADRIDGDWCRSEGGGHFRIEGSRIETVTGRVTTGDYGRHSFVYLVPQGDPGAGSEVRMRLLNEEEVRVWFTPGESEVWERCKPVS